MKHLLRDKIEVFSKTGRDKFGKPLSGGSNTYKGRFKEETESYFDKDGNELKSNATIIFVERFEIDQKVKFEGLQYRIVGFKRVNNSTNTVFYKYLLERI